MKYRCRQCELTFEDERSADTHEYENGHKVELQISSTYWGAHMAPVMH